MTDLHSHLLFDFDDGAKDPGMCEKILQRASAQGVRCMAATSHAGADQNSCYETRFQAVKELAERYSVRLLPGSEYSCRSLLQGDPEALRPLGNSRFLLLDCGTITVDNALLNRMIFLAVKKYRIVLAHPERIWIGRSCENIGLFAQRFEVAVQLNAGSLLGRYGRREKKEAWQIVESGLCHLIASDVHRADGCCLAECRDYLSHFFPEPVLSLWFETNPQRILSDQMPLPVLPAKNGFWKRAILRRFF